MTRGDAITELKILREDYWDDDNYGHETGQYDSTILALDIAIKALEQGPVFMVQSKPLSKSERDTLIKALKRNPLITAESNITIEQINQEPKADVLDKIRAEIEQVSFTHYFEYGEYLGEYTRQERIVNFDSVMQIIDKYKAESEGDE